jgi:hypothetical protein
MRKRLADMQVIEWVIADYNCFDKDRPRHDYRPWGRCHGPAHGSRLADAAPDAIPRIVRFRRLKPGLWRVTCQMAMLGQLRGKHSWLGEDALAHCEQLAHARILRGLQWLGGSREFTYRIAWRRHARWGVRSEPQWPKGPGLAKCGTVPRTVPEVP